MQIASCFYVAVSFMDKFSRSLFSLHIKNVATTSTEKTKTKYTQAHKY